MMYKNMTLLDLKVLSWKSAVLLFGGTPGIISILFNQWTTLLHKSQYNTQREHVKVFNWQYKAVLFNSYAILKLKEIMIVFIRENLWNQPWIKYWLKSSEHNLG